MTGKRTDKERISSFTANKSLSLQPRDLLMMTFVAEFRLLSREQLQILLDFPCITRINVRLKKLYDHGYLSRLFLPTVTCIRKPLYFLGRKGIGKVSEYLGLDPLSLERERKHLQDRKELFLNHQLFLNDVRIAFTFAAQNTARMTLEQWIKEKDINIQFLNSQREQIILKPDGCLCLTYNGKLYSFFIEVDCSTMTNRRLKAKAQNYLDYARSGLSRQDFGFQFFRVLIITKTEKRLLNLKASIEELTDRIFCFAVEVDVCQGRVLARIWRRAGRQDFFHLLEA